MLKINGFQKTIILALVLTLIVFSAAACGVDEEELEELEEMEDEPIDDEPVDDGLGFNLDFESSIYTSIDGFTITL